MLLRSIIMIRFAARQQGTMSQLPFLDRKDEVNRLMTLLTGRGNFKQSHILMGPRNTGKTSMLYDALAKCEADVRARTFTLNLKAVDGERDDALFELVREGLLRFATRQPLAILASTAALDTELRDALVREYAKAVESLPSRQLFDPVLNVLGRGAIDASTALLGNTTRMSDGLKVILSTFLQAVGTDRLGDPVADKGAEVLVDTIRRVFNQQIKQMLETAYFKHNAFSYLMRTMTAFGRISLACNLPLPNLVVLDAAVLSRGNGLFYNYHRQLMMPLRLAKEGHLPFMRLLESSEFLWAKTVSGNVESFDMHVLPFMAKDQLRSELTEKYFKEDEFEQLWKYLGGHALNWQKAHSLKVDNCLPTDEIIKRLLSVAAIDLRNAIKSSRTLYTTGRAGMRGHLYPAGTDLNTDLLRHWLGGLVKAEEMKCDQPKWDTSVEVQALSAGNVLFFDRLKERVFYQNPLYRHVAEDVYPTALLPV